MYKNTLSLTIGIMLILVPLYSHAMTVYSNNFDNGVAALADFEFGNVGSSTSIFDINVVDGQLSISPGAALPSGAYASVNNASFLAPYSSVLSNNTGLVSWSFNVSNEDGDFNNSFAFALASSAPDARIYTSSSYVFQGGGMVGNRMALFRQIGPELGGPSFTPIIDITSGLGVLPSVGSFRITYDPSSHLWSLYGLMSNLEADPIQVENLLGQVFDNYLTDIPLEYMSMIAMTTGTAYFDNVTVAVESVCSGATTTTIRGYGQKPTTTDLEIQTEFTAVDGGGIIEATPNNVLVCEGTTLTINTKVGNGPYPTSLTLDGVSLDPNALQQIMVTGTHKLVVSNKDNGGKDRDRITIEVYKP
jgi:hypothetical protein